MEFISPISNGNMIMKDVFKTLPEHVSLIGGIEPAEFLTSPIEKIMEYCINLIHSHGKRVFVPDNPDSCLSGIPCKKFLKISRPVKEAR